MKKTRIKYLITYSELESEHTFFIAPFGYDQFVGFYKDHYSKIEIRSFFGSTLDRNYNLEDSSSIKTIQNFDSYLNENQNQDLVLNDLEFEIVSNGNCYSFIDNSDCTLTSKNKIQFMLDVDFLFNRLAFDKNILEKMLKNNGHYLAVNLSNEIEAEFGSFEDYLASDFTIDYPRN